jgi:hypothetical protein
MTAAERALCAEEWWAAAVWCAKECLYKMAGREGADFKRDIVVESVDTSTSQILCRAYGEPITLCYAMPDEKHLLAYSL